MLIGDFLLVGGVYSLLCRSTRHQTPSSHTSFSHFKYMGLFSFLNSSKSDAKDLDDAIPKKTQCYHIASIDTEYSNRHLF